MPFYGVLSRNGGHTNRLYQLLILISLFLKKIVYRHEASVHFALVFFCLAKLFEGMKEMNVLAIGAHPDDIEMNCFGTLQKYAKHGHSIKLVVVTKGNIGHYQYSDEELTQIRKKEAEKTAEMLGCPIMFLDFDERIEDNTNTRNAIINAIRWADPDVIFTQNPACSSVDHAITGTIVKQSLIALKWAKCKTEYPPTNKQPSVFFFETNGGFNFQPDCYIDITDEMEEKRVALRNHKSQVELGQDDVSIMDIMEISSAYRGMQSGCRYAEAFAAHRAAENVANYKLLP